MGSALIVNATASAVPSFPFTTNQLVVLFLGG
jgi:hypothetical protein